MGLMNEPLNITSPEKHWKYHGNSLSRDCMGHSTRLGTSGGSVGQMPCIAGEVPIGIQSICSLVPGLPVSSPLWAFQKFICTRDQGDHQENIHPEGRVTVHKAGPRTTVQGGGRAIPNAAGCVALESPGSWLPGFVPEPQERTALTK